MAGEIGVYYLKQFAPAVPDRGWLLLSVGRQVLLHLRSGAVIIIENLMLHSPHCRQWACDATHFSQPARKDTHVQSSRCGHNSSPASPGVRAQGRLTHAGVTAIAVLEKDCLVSQSRHLLPVEPFCRERKTKCPKRLASNSADKGRLSQGRWKRYQGAYRVICWDSTASSF